MQNSSNSLSSFLVCPALGICTWALAQTTHALALLRPVLSLVFGARLGELLTQPIVFAALIAFAGVLVQVTAQVVLTFKKDEWRRRALNAERALVKANRGD